MENDNCSIQRMEEFKYFETTLTNKNSFQEEIKSRWKIGDACYYSVQNLCLPVCYPKI
jgi:UDP-galactopyranose mutase